METNWSIGLTSSNGSGYVLMKNSNVMISIGADSLMLCKTYSAQQINISGPPFGVYNILQAGILFTTDYTQGRKKRMWKSCVLSIVDIALRSWRCALARVYEYDIMAKSIVVAFLRSKLSLHTSSILNSEWRMYVSITLIEEKRLLLTPPLNNFLWSSSSRDFLRNGGCMYR